MTTLEDRITAILLALSRELSDARNLQEAAEGAFIALREPFGIQTLGFSMVPRQTQTFRTEYTVTHPFEPDQGYLLSNRVDARVIPHVIELLQAEPAGAVNTWQNVFDPNHDLQVHALEMFQSWRHAHAGMFINTSNNSELYSNVSIHRAVHEFSDDDKEAFETIAPLLRAVTQSLILREEAEFILAGADEVAALQGRLLLLLNEQLEVEWASPDYRERLEPFMGRWHAPIWPQLAAWLRAVAMPEGTLQIGRGPWQKVLRARRGAVRFRASVTRGASGGLGLLIGITLCDPTEQLAKLEALGLTPREIDVVGFLPRGLTNQQIAHALSIREVTVKKHLRNIGDKLGVRGKVKILSRLTQTLNHSGWADPQDV